MEVLTRHRLGLPRVRNQENVANVAGTSKRVPFGVACLLLYLAYICMLLPTLFPASIYSFLSQLQYSTVQRYSIKVFNSSPSVYLAVDNFEAVHRERRMMWHHKRRGPTGTFGSDAASPTRLTSCSACLTSESSPTSYSPLIHSTTGLPRPYPTDLSSLTPT